MQSSNRTLVFCLALLAAPGLYALGLWLGGDVLGATLALAGVVAGLVWAELGQRRPPAGTTPS